MPVYQEKDKNKITKNGNTWYYRCYYTDKYGKRKQKESKKYATKKEAQIAERDFLKNTSTTDEIDYNVSFDIVYNEWLEYKKKAVKVTVFYNLKSSLDKNIYNYFKDYKLHSIKINIINNWINGLIEKDGSINWLNTMINYFKDMLNYARKYYDYDEKIIDSIQNVRDDKPKDKPTDAEINFWTYEEFQQFIKVVDNRYYYILFNFLYYTGLRVGELMALNWNDIDFKNHTLNITKALSVKVKGQDYVITKPKTENSIRIVDLDKNLIMLLKEHRKNEEKIYGFNNDMFLFGNVKHISQTTLKRHLDKYIKIAGVKHITIHGFRHSHISLLIYLGCDSRDVANRVGDTVETIEKTYIHMFPKKKEKTISVLNDFVK